METLSLAFRTADDGHVYPLGRRRRHYTGRAPKVNDIKNVAVVPVDSDSRAFSDKEGDVLRAFSSPGPSETMTVGDYWEGRKDGNVVPEFAASATHEEIHKSVERAAGEEASARADSVVRRTVQNDQLFLPTKEDRRRIREARKAGYSWEKILAPYRQAHDEGKLTDGELKGIVDFVRKASHKRIQKPREPHTVDFPTTEYDPSRFPGLVMRGGDHKPTTMVFKNGKAVVVGASSERQGRKVLREVAGRLREKGFPVEEPKVKTQSVVMTYDLGTPLDLNAVEMSSREQGS